MGTPRLRLGRDVAVDSNMSAGHIAAPEKRDGAAEAPPAAPTEPGRPHRQTRLEYNPALDGIRGCAVAAVLLFHSGFSWARGGYLGVSTFFTLSGFLITSLLLTEHAARGRVDLRRFWAGRSRRLLPASLATLVVVALSVPLVKEAWERGLSRDVITSAFQVANWNFLWSGQSYGELFSDDRSPVLHFWSLAIEAQFYWLFPLVAVGALSARGGSPRRLLYVVGGLIGLSLLLTLIYRQSDDVVYYSTPTRMGEILAGALLAVVIASNPGRLVEGVAGRAGGIVGAGALAVSVVAWARVDLDSSWLYDGGLLAFSLVSVALVWGVSASGPLRSALSFEPLRLLGVISYGVYLIHWPIFRLLDKPRVDDLLSPFRFEVQDWQLFAVRLLVTLVLAIISYHLLELPIRARRRPRSSPPLLAAGGALVAVIVVAVAVPTISKPPSDEFLDARGRLAETERLAPEALEANGGHVGVTIGDSTMLMTAIGLVEWGFQTERVALPGSGGDFLGCGIGRGGERRWGTDEVEVHDEWCWEDGLVPSIAAARDHYGDLLTFAVIQTGPWDVADRRLEGDDDWWHIGDPVYDEFLESEMTELIDLVQDEGLAVIWLTAPAVEPASGTSFPESDPARIARLNEMMEQLAGEREGVATVDLAGWFESLPADEQQRLRPDGVHFTYTRADFTALEVAERFLGEELLAAVEAAVDET